MTLPKAEEIFYNQFGRNPTWDDLYVMKEYARQVLDCAAEEAETGYDSANNVMVDKQSILKIKDEL
jgi:hypothetical protein